MIKTTYEKLNPYLVVHSKFIYKYKQRIVKKNKKKVGNKFCSIFPMLKMEITNNNPMFSTYLSSAIAMFKMYVLHVHVPSFTPQRTYYISVIKQALHDPYLEEFRRKSLQHIKDKSSIP